jgi:hypothetical protein
MYSRFSQPMKSGIPWPTKFFAQSKPKHIMSFHLMIDRCFGLMLPPNSADCGRTIGRRNVKTALFTASPGIARWFGIARWYIVCRDGQGSVLGLAPSPRHRLQVVV